MITERNWYPIPVQTFTANGGTAASGSPGLVTLASTFGFSVKQKVIVIANSLPSLELEVKQVPSETTLYVGVPGNINLRQDLTGYTVAANAQIYANLQVRSSIPEKEYFRAVYAEEPVVGIRTISVDPFGNYYTAENPLPISFDGTVEIGEVSIVEGGNTMVVNPNGSINVVVQNSSGGTTVNTFNEVTAVPSGVLTTITSYAVPAAKTAVLERITVSGENIAEYEIFINTTLVDVRRTFWGQFDADLEYISNGMGFSLNTGDQVFVKVIHSRPTSANFDSRIQVVES